MLRGGIPTDSKTEKQNQDERKAWGAYMGRQGQSGQLVGGLPLMGEGRRVSSAGVTRDDVTSTREGIVGCYLIVKAASLEEAGDVAKDCPHIANQGNMEVREIARMPTMYIVEA